MGSLRILLVDDSRIIRGALTELIQRSSRDWLVCGEAVDGSDALRQAAELNPDVVLLDLSLPVQNGLQVANILRKTSSSLKIVIMSEHDPVTLSRVSKEYGFECVPKSRIVSELLPILQRLAAQQP